MSSRSLFAPAAGLALGVAACSTSVLFIKESSLHPFLLSSFRLFVAAILLAPLFVRDLLRHRQAFGRPELRRSLLPGVALALHFASWVVGARTTLAANATLIVNMVPLAMPFLLVAIARERITRPELTGTLLGVAGVAILAGGDVGTGYFAGDLVCFGSMLVYAAYLALGRRNRDLPSVWLYVVPLYAVAGVVCLVLGAPELGVVRNLPAKEWGLVLALGVIPTIVGHSLLNQAMRVFPGGAVSVANLGQFVFAALGAYLIHRELPAALFWPAAALVVLGAIVALRPANRA